MVLYLPRSLEVQNVMHGMEFKPRWIILLKCMMLVFKGSNSVWDFYSYLPRSDSS